MSFDHDQLLAAIKNSGGAEQPPDEVDALLGKLRLLDGAGRYGALLKALGAANDKTNFASLVLEATFAFQFERQGIPLTYEVRQPGGDGSSVDFLVEERASGQRVFLELRDLAEDKATQDDIKAQLAEGAMYAVSKDAAAQQDAIFRLQGTALSKVQKKDGKPSKFFLLDDVAVNIVVVTVSDILLGTADAYDCLLAVGGDSAVPEEFRLGVFGMFQTASPEEPQPFKDQAERFKRFREVVHAAMFLFKEPGGSPLAFDLEQVLTWNRHLLSPERFEPI